MMFTYSVLAVVIGFFLDLCFGDPYWMPHIIRLMGKSISLLEKIFYRWKNRYVGGFFVVFFMLVFYGAIPGGLFWYLYQLNWMIALPIESFVCYQMLAAKSLRVESMKVYRALQKDDVEGARKAVSMIVGRDTMSLDSAGITRAAVETVAENTSDGEIAPLFYMIIGGAPLAMAYKAINTMDSMIGYHNERYEQFGFCAARMDDVANFIPARLAAVLMIFATIFARMNTKNAWKIFKRDRFNHKSPNSAQTESVCAGALEVRLAGNAYYFGKLVEKPWIGDPIREIETGDIKRANKLLYVASFLMLVIAVTIKISVIYLIDLYW